MRWVRLSFRPKILSVVASALGGGTCGVAWAQPVNDVCAAATNVAVGQAVSGSVVQATSDGGCSCAQTGLNLPDVYHRFMPAAAGIYTFSLCGGTTWDTVISLHSDCPATAANQIDCNDEGCRPSGATTFGWPSVMSAFLSPGSTFIVRISGYDFGSAFGQYQLRVSGPTTPTGACCISTSCTQQTQGTCALAGGTYLGNYFSCIAPALNPSAYAGTGLPVQIPDDLASGVSRTISVPDAFNVGDVRLGLSLSHAFMGDLTVTVSHGGRSATILSHVRGGLYGTGVDLSGNYTFSDGAIRSPWDTAEVIADNSLAALPTGTYFASDGVGQVVSLREVFNGLSSAGDWTITVVDSAPGFGGTLSAFSLTLDRTSGDACTTQPPASGACCIGGGTGGSGSGSTCSVLTPAGCAGSSGAYQGGGTVCGTGVGNPIICCRANFNQVGGVSVQDVFDFLTAWFSSAASADFNGIGGITIQDIFDFLGAWFGGCTTL